MKTTQLSALIASMMCLTLSACGDEDSELGQGNSPMLRVRASAGSEAGTQVASTQVAGQNDSGSETAGMQGTGAEVAGFETAGIDDAGTQVAGVETAGSETEGGAETAGAEASGTESAGVSIPGMEAGGVAQPMICGDQLCDSGEDCELCPEDCGVCGAPVVVINEVVAKAVDDGDDWVELYNVGSGEADLGGWTLEDDGGNAYTLPAPLLLRPDTYLLILSSEFDFGLGRDDAVTLKNERGEIIDIADWSEGDAPEGTSWARSPNGTGAFVTTAQPTPQSVNVLVAPASCGDAVCDDAEDCDRCPEDCGACPACPTELFISEYVEGSSNNKALELYNGTSADIDLSAYEIWKITNGGEWAESTTALEGVLPANSVFVICHRQADAQIFEVCDEVYGSDPMNFNGDDAIGLARWVDDGFVLIDQIGESGRDVGEGWSVDGVSNATKNHTLVRKPLTGPTTAWSESSARDWLVYERDVFEYLGAHELSPSCVTP